MDTVKIKTVNNSSNDLPHYATQGAAGMDIRAHLEAAVTLAPLQRMLIPSGIFMEIPEGFEVQIRPRSGLAFKNGITCLNTPGTIDSDYRGELKILLINLSNEPQTLNNGDRIAQLIVAKTEKAELILVQQLNETERAAAGSDIQVFKKIYMRLLTYFFIATAVLLFSQCRSGRTITKAIAPRDTTKIVQIKSSADSLLVISSTREMLKKNKIEYRTFSAKIKLDIEDSKGKKPDLVANVRMIKDSAIWISISATILNVEVFRVFINKDSVILLNKQEKTVQYRSLDYLQEITDIPFDFKTLQDLIVGNPIFFNDSNITVRKYENFSLISSVKDPFKNLLTVSVPDNLLQHSKLDDLDLMQNRTADFTYDSYSNNSGFPFSTYRQIIATEKNKLDVRMNFKQYEFNKELSVSFSVPKNYKKN